LELTLAQTLYTLDTNICSYILRRRPPDFVEKFQAINTSDIWLSSIVAAELRFGAAKLDNRQFTATIESWLSSFEIKPWGAAESIAYARIRNELTQSGQMIGGMDLMIAAHAVACQSTLISSNVKEFQRITGLRFEGWVLAW
jgi:tRNA(fMet)-specific endonuclease VapC